MILQAIKPERLCSSFIMKTAFNLKKPWYTLITNHMKALKDMDHFDKMVAIFDLFPEDVEPFLDFIQESATAIRKADAFIRSKWSHPDFSFEEYSEIIAHTENNISLYRSWHEKTNREIGGLLTCHNLHVWTEHCITAYASYSVKNESKLNIAVMLFYGTIIPSEFTSVSIKPSLN